MSLSFIGINIARIQKMQGAGNLYKDGKAWYAENPTACKVLISSHIKGVQIDGIEINSVNGEKPKMHGTSKENGFYLLPGKHTVEATHIESRPGILFSKVRTWYGPLKQEVVVEEGKTYNYAYNKKEGFFELMKLRKA